ncbi:hypothetical protein SASPL_123533 [Salvia splendens]|uniref:Pentatricopeptide repeat-containing protein n=1 Tax=Salvia splendens TaxID=180675 RepID=A0A8X8XP89_SALSN|nr:hypothetical protein SASPL_123533 [Salvia splendens]
MRRSFWGTRGVRPNAREKCVFLEQFAVWYAKLGMAKAYVQSERLDEAVRFYLDLRSSDCGGNAYCFAGVLIVCVKLRALGLLKQLHCQAFVLGFLLNAVISSSIMDANAKCGEMGDGRSLFDEMKWRDKNSISWTTLISGYAQNGMLFKEMIKSSIEPDQYTYSCLPNAVVVSSLIDMYSKCGSLDIAKTVFDDMVRLGLWPDSVTFLALLNGCSMQEGLALFGSMKADYEIVPDQEHYACLIDLLGQIHGNVGLSRIMMRHLVEVDPHSSAAYLMLALVYAAHGRYEFKSIEKVPAVRWVEVDRKLQSDTKGYNLCVGIIS